MTDYDNLAAATVAGHILECGTQSTGGNFDGWRDIPDLAHIGYPIAEAYADGTVVITKHDGTGGRVSRDTVTAQLLYELGDPERYLTPDVVARGHHRAPTTALTAPRSRREGPSGHAHVQGLDEHERRLQARR
jgi:hypothetical protein